MFQLIFDPAGVDLSGQVVWLIQQETKKWNGRVYAIYPKGRQCLLHPSYRFFAVDSSNDELGEQGIVKRRDGVSWETMAINSYVRSFGRSPFVNAARIGAKSMLGGFSGDAAFNRVAGEMDVCFLEE